MIDSVKINKSSHIAIIANNETFSLANAVYSYILTLHKKVSLVVPTEIEQRFDFLPWYDKSRTQVPSSCDLQIELDLDTLVLYKELSNLDIKINTKIATALYSSFLIEDEKYGTLLCDGMKLAVMSELINLGADCSLCIENLQQTKALSLFRLKSYIFGSFVIKENGHTVEAYIDDTVLKKSGASLIDTVKISKELLTLAHIKKVVLVKEDENKIISEIKE